MLKCYAIAEDQQAVNSITNYLEKIPNAVLVGSNSHPILALEEINSGNIPHILFFDIDMSDLFGIAIVDLLPSETSVIFITEHKHYAFEAFEKNALGFILKPLTLEKTVKSLHRVKYVLEKLQRVVQLPLQEKLFIKIGAIKKIVQLNIKDIVFVKALDHYVNIHTHDESYIVHLTMGTMEEKLPKTTFSRIHKTYIVNTDIIKSIEDNHVFLVSGHKFPCGGDLYKKPFLEKINSKMIKRPGNN